MTLPIDIGGSFVRFSPSSAAPAAGTPAKDEPAKEEPVDISVDDDIVELPKDVIDLKYEELTLF